MSNWNADFSGYPKTTTAGDTFGSDKAFKFPIKKMWENQGEKVIYIKSYKIDDEGENIVPRTLKERYEKVFNVEDLKKQKNAKEILTNLFSAIDVKNFGATFAESGSNISITGAVQIGQGFNKYADTQPQEQSILSPFRDPKGKPVKETDEEARTKDEQDKTTEAKNSTLGTKIVSDEAHYVYPFVINPQAYDEYAEMGVTDGYTEEDYAKFKEAALSAATSFATNAKIGCENEFSVFVETKSDVYLPNLSEYITFTKKDNINEITLGFGSLLKEMGEDVLSVEIYYNPYTTELNPKIEGAKYYNIFTRKEV